MSKEFKYKCFICEKDIKYDEVVESMQSLLDDEEGIVCEYYSLVHIDGDEECFINEEDPIRQEFEEEIYGTGILCKDCINEAFENYSEDDE